MSIPERWLANASTCQLDALGVSIHPTKALARHRCVLRTILRAFHNFPLDADEHPDPSSDKLCNFDPEDEKRAFSLRFRVQMA